jgi:alkyl sulfatase BDS1-like metallo-beta-lactamase superfamily hydrolase
MRPRELAELEADGDLNVTGDRDALLALLAVLDRFSLMFPIVTP